MEYEEPKPKVKSELAENGRKRRLVKEKDIEITQQQLLNQYVSQMQPISSTPKPPPTIIIDDKSQDHHDMTKTVELDLEPPAKISRIDEKKVNKMDKFDIFGLFVASEMRNLKNQSLQKKLKRKILECVLEMSDQDSDNAN